MSRCFPYPPPGYTITRSYEEAALIESIKLQKEREKAKRERKEEKKRAKKEKRKERKENSKPILDDSSAQKHKVHKQTSEIQDNPTGRKRSSESEHLERSNLTEEFGHAIRSEHPNNSTDSTQDSSKRRKVSSPSDVTRPQGNVIRIRLSSQKQINNDQIPSTSGRVDLPPQPKSETIVNKLSAVQKVVDESLPPVPCSLKTCSSSRVAQKEVGKILPRPPRLEKPLSKEEIRYRNLIEKWVPPSLNDNLDSIDEDWLFNGKQTKKVEKQPIPTTNMLCSSSALWPPRAQFLPDAEIYALPYTIPF